MEHAELATEWTRILAPTTGDVRRELVAEAAEFLGIPITTAWDRLNGAGERFREEWMQNVQDSRDPHALLRFYNQSDCELFELIEWHASDRIHYRTLIARDYARRTPARACLDYGSGIGSDALVLAHSGFDVTLADVSEVLLGFAAFRLRRRGFVVKTIDLKSAALPRDAYDLVLCFDVLEHIPEPLEAVRQIKAAMRDAAVLLMHAPFGDDPEHPMHVVHRDVVTPRMRSLGFQPVDWRFPPEVRTPLIYRKQQVAAIDRVGYFLYDGYLQNPLGHHAAAWYRRLFRKKPRPGEGGNVNLSGVEVS